MRIKEAVKITSIALALVSLAGCLFIWGQLSGFEKGYFYGVFQDPPQTTGFSGGETNYFQLMNMSYFIIAMVFCVYIIGKILKPLLVSSIICFSSRVLKDLCKRVVLVTAVWQSILK